MGLLDTLLFGDGRPSPADEKALERYRYLLRTAPPDAIEQAHAEAFAQLTPPQRAEVLRRLSEELPGPERPREADPQTLARSATRAELRHPGVLERALGGGLLGSVVGTFVASSIATQIMGGEDDPGADDDLDGDFGDL